MPTIISINANRAVDLNGLAVPGALATFYNSGTTQERTVFSDPACEVPHPTPVAANGAGVFPLIFDASEGDASVVITSPDGVTLPGYPIDPVVMTSTEQAGASGVVFEPTAEIPETDVQAAIERVQQNIAAPLADFGLGVTGNAGLLADIDATNIASGVYRFDGTTAGTFPIGVTKANGGTVRIWRENASSGLMILAENGFPNQFVRRLSSAWGAWLRVMTTADTAPNATWAAGASSAAYVVSPDNVRAAVDARMTGNGQDWVAPARVAGTTYTNGTGRTIFVSVCSSGGGSFQVRKNSGSAWIALAGSQNVGNDLCFYYGPIPAGYEYRVATAGGAVIEYWAELR